MLLAMRGRRARGSLLVATIALASGAYARADGPVAHEYVPDLAENEGSILVSSGGPEPEALVYDGEVIPAPEGGALRDEERAMETQGGDGARQEEVGRRSPSFRPDRVTELHGQVGYFEVFSPTIAPFKRVTALDGVGVGRDGTPVLAIAERGPRRRVEIEGAQASPPDGRARDRFWGSVVLDLRSGAGGGGGGESGRYEVPLPSVSPESRILTLRTEPQAAIHLERDGADNFFAVLEMPAPGLRQVRVVFLTDAPRTYFGTTLPTTRADAMSGEIPQLPPSLERRGLAFAATLGLSPSTPFDVALGRLTEHFRSFEESREPPTDTGDIYWDLATGMRGVCRHRAYGFVITAHALGIMARFVQNEAHAWVEVHLPANGGWMRIDLGGSPRGLTAHNADERPAYRPRISDPLPRPAEYERAYAEARRMSEERAAERGERASAGDGSEAGARAEASQSGSGSGSGSGGAGEGSIGGAPSGASDRRAQVIEGGAPRDVRASLDLALDVEPRMSVLRGGTIEVSGTARASGAGVDALRVEVLLASERGPHERLLGVTVTNEHGMFRGSFGVPPDVAIGDYRLIVRSPGNHRVGPAMAR
jgi:hypothetical protein